MIRQLEHLRVLVVDDQESARTMAKKMLTALRIGQVFQASSGREAMKFLEDSGGAIDLIMCDWNMPEMNGLEMLAQARSVGFDIPFLMVTGRADVHSVMEAKSAGVSSYVAKPFLQAQLEVKLRMVASKAGQRQSSAA